MGWESGVVVLDSVSSPLLVSVVLGSAFIYSVVAAADAAMSALPTSRLAALHEQAKGKVQERLGRFVAEPARVLGRWLVARALCGVVVAVGIGELVKERSFSVVMVIGVGVLLLSLLSEITTAMARARPTQLGPVLLALLRPVELLMVPLADPLSWVGQWVRRRFSGGQNEEVDPELTEAEMEHMVEDAAKAGELEAEPAEMIRNVLELKDLTVRDVMVPRIRIVAIEVETPLVEVIRIVAQEEHSRYPVYSQIVDNVVGLLYAKDLLPLFPAGEMEGKSLRDILRTPVNFIPDMQPVATVLGDMRGRRQHMAVLVDEFGGVSGLVTLEDLLERIVGDIRDEYDREEAPIQDLGGGRLLVDAAVSLTDLSTYLGADIGGGGDYGSLGGLLMHEAGRVPTVGDRIVVSDLECTVQEGDAKRILKVEISRPGMLSSTPSQRVPVN